MEIAGIEVREEITSSEGRIAWLTDEAAAKLRAAGRLVSTRSDHVIPQHVVQTASELEALLAEYQSFAQGFSSRLVLRGQNRDYFDKHGFLSVLPYSLRTRALRDKFDWSSRRSSDLDAMLSTWEAVLNSLSVDVDSMGREERVLDGQKIIVHDRAATTRVASNPQFGAILQHYGFPTPHLDATSSADVAVYFALHRARSTRDGLRFAPVKVSARLGHLDEPIPTLHIYFAHSPMDLGAPTIELYSLPDLMRVAKRPVAQQAHSLTFVVHYFDVVGVGNLLYTEKHFPRFPVAIVKLLFPYVSASETFRPLTQRELFPTDEPLYAALSSASAPYLARYASASAAVRI